MSGMLMIPSTQMTFSKLTLETQSGTMMNLKMELLPVAILIVDRETGGREVERLDLDTSTLSI